ncbi:hypothetical protein ABGB16_10555 [Micromonospora sp. B11E3]|uniref:hypothetical protein n=1 Tax=Micromonospora sp. B11E3 TaxID=3153562 RepID=UPI00325C931A
MGRRWKWFLRPGRAGADLTGQVVPDGDVPGRYRRPSAPDGVPDGLATSRCDGAVVYERPARRRAAPARNERADRYDPKPPGARQRRADRTVEGRGSDG